MQGDDSRTQKNPQEDYPTKEASGRFFDKKKLQGDSPTRINSRRTQEDCPYVTSRAQVDGPPEFPLVLTLVSHSFGS